LGVAFRITNDVECAEDIVQDACVAALEKTSEFRALSSLKTYLYRIVINKSIDARRRRILWWNLLETRRDELSDTLHGGRESANADMLESVRIAIDRIPNRFTIPFLLAEVDGMSYEEIADVLQVTLNTVRTRIFRCREKLRKQLKKTGRLK
jgi:RNA polymerase sigma-70 factor (ECF subfamily)